MSYITLPSHSLEMLWVRLCFFLLKCRVFPKNVLKGKLEDLGDLRICYFRV